MDNLHILARIRFRNKQEVQHLIPICRWYGYHVFSILNEDYFSKNGILTYKVDLIGNGVILDQWRHQLWAELITFDDQIECENACEELEMRFNDNDDGIPGGEHLYLGRDVDMDVMLPEVETEGEKLEMQTEFELN